MSLNNWRSYLAFLIAMSSLVACREGGPSGTGSSSSSSGTSSAGSSSSGTSPTKNPTSPVSQLPPVQTPPVTGKSTPPPTTTTTTPNSSTLTTLKVRVQAVRVGNSDGSQLTTMNGSSILSSVISANVFFAKAGIELQFDPNKDIVTKYNDDLNRDWVLANGATLNALKSQMPAVDTTASDAARRSLARSYFGKAVWLFAQGSGLTYDNNQMKWTIVPRWGGFSNSYENYAALCGACSGNSGPFVSHESGHYFHLPHTHGWLPKDANELSSTIKTYVESYGWSKDDGVKIFDADPFFVGDTPADPGPEIYTSLGLDACGKQNQFSISVKFSDGTLKAYSFSPDRGNLMSYFKECGGMDHYFSNDQAQRMRRSLLYGNRGHLLSATPQADWEPPTPGIVSWGTTRFDFFPINGDTGVLQKVRMEDGTSWYPANKDRYDYLGGLTAGTVSAVSPGYNKYDLFARGLDGYIWHKAWNGSVWIPPRTSQTSWEILGKVSGGSTIVGDPVSVIDSNGVIHIFARSKTGTVKHVMYQSGKESWEDIGGNITGNVAAVARSGGQIDLFARGSDGFLLRGTSKGGWTSLGKTITDSPSAISFDVNRIDVLVRAVNGNVLHGIIDNPSTITWIDVGGGIIGKPMVVSWGKNRIDVFGRGLDSTVLHSATADGKSWTGWESLGGVSHTQPAVIAVAKDRIDLVIWGKQDSGLWHKAWQNGAWVPSGTSWKELGVTY